MGLNMSQATVRPIYSSKIGQPLLQLNPCTFDHWHANRMVRMWRIKYYLDVLSNRLMRVRTLSFGEVLHVFHKLDRLQRELSLMLISLGGLGRIWSYLEREISFMFATGRYSTRRTLHYFTEVFEEK